MLEGGANGFGRNFVERNAKNFLRIYGWNLFFRFVLRRLFHHFGFGVLFLEAGDGGFLLRILGRLRKHHGEVRGNRFSFAVRVARQVDGVRGVGSFTEIVDDLAFARNDLKGWLKNLFVIQRYRRTNRLFFYFLRAFFDSLLFLSVVFFFAGQTDTDRFLGEIHHVANGGLDEEIPPQVLINCLRLCRRLDDHELV